MTTTRETRWTPGPWEFNWIAGTIEASDGEIILEFADPQAPPERNANARLIAAAPALHEALQLAGHMLLIDAQSFREMGEVGKAGCIEKFVEDQVRAAISAAEGEK